MARSLSVNSILNRWMKLSKDRQFINSRSSTRHKTHVCTQPRFRIRLDAGLRIWRNKTSISEKRHAMQVSHISNPSESWKKKLNNIIFLVSKKFKIKTENHDLARSKTKTLFHSLPGRKLFLNIDPNANLKKKWQDLTD